MADFIFNIAKGRIAEYAERVNANDPTNSVFLVVPVLTAGIETDAVLKDKDDLAAVFSGATDEAAAGGWGRKSLDNTAGITITPDDTNDWVDVDIPDQTWTTVAAGNNISKLLVCYDSDSTGGADSAIIPLSAHDFVIVTDGTDIIAQIATGGFFRAA